MKREQDGQIVTQFDYPTCEGLGLIKMDFLGLRNLTIISDALENNRQHRNEAVPYTHLEVYKRQEFRAVLQEDPDAKTVYETALGLEGLKLSLIHI